MRPEQDLLCFSDVELSEIVSNFMMAARLLNFLARQHDGAPNDATAKDDFSFMRDPQAPEPGARVSGRSRRIRKPLFKPRAGKIQGPAKQLISRGFSLPLVAALLKRPYK